MNQVSKSKEQHGL